MTNPNTPHAITESLIEKLEAAKLNMPKNKETPIMFCHDNAFDRAIAIVRQHHFEPVSLEKCVASMTTGVFAVLAPAWRHELAKAVLTAAGIPYVE